MIYHGCLKHFNLLRLREIHQTHGFENNRSFALTIHLWMEVDWIWIFDKKLFNQTTFTFVHSSFILVNIDDEHAKVYSFLYLSLSLFLYIRSNRWFLINQSNNLKSLKGERFWVPPMQRTHTLHPRKSRRRGSDGYSMRYSYSKSPSNCSISVSLFSVSNYISLQTERIFNYACAYVLKQQLNENALKWAFIFTNICD